MLFWLLDNLKFATEDTLWVGIKQELGVEHAVEARLRREYPTLDLRVVTIDFHTRGAAETLFIMLQVRSQIPLTYFAFVSLATRVRVRCYGNMYDHINILVFQKNNNNKFIKITKEHYVIPYNKYQCY